MPQITKIQALYQHKKRLAVHLDEEPWAVLGKALVASEGLLIGSELSPERQVFLLAEDAKSAVKLSLWLLERRAHTRFELDRKLKEYGYPEETRANTLARMMKAGYVNDSALAELAAQRYAEQRLGRGAVAQKLRRRGLDHPVIETAMENLDPDRESQDARLLAANLWKRYAGEDSFRRRQKTAAALARRGYDWDLIRGVMEALEQEDSF